MNRPSVRKARNDGVRHTEDPGPITEDVGDVRTYRFQSQESAIFRRNQMKELRCGGEVVNDVIVVVNDVEGVV
jgi:hypothetical protein